MKTRVLIILLAVAATCAAQGQSNAAYKVGYTAIKNLESVANVRPYSDGGLGFDDRYMGVKGTREVFDTLRPSYLLLKGQQEWVSLNANMDVVDNKLLFTHPKTGDLLWIPAEMVKKLVVTADGQELVFITTEGMRLDRKEDSIKFCQVLLEEPYHLIKLPYKRFIEANYKALYSPGVFYDEYETKARYYVSGADNYYHHVMPNRKSLLKVFPEQKDAINGENEKQYADPEQYLIAVVRKFR